MACQQKTERIIEVLSSADRRNRLIEWLRSMTESAHVRTMTFFNNQNDRVQLPKKSKRYFDDGGDITYA